MNRFRVSIQKELAIICKKSCMEFDPQVIGLHGHYLRILAAGQYLSKKQKCRVRVCAERKRRDPVALLGCLT